MYFVGIVDHTGRDIREMTFASVGLRLTLFLARHIPIAPLAQ
jgi:hypothetical protein